MDTNKILGIEGTGQPVDPKHAAKGVEDTEFRRVLERLEQISKRSEPQKDVKDTENFLEAMREADADFMTAMDLRRKLEQAYRDKQP